MVKIWGACRWSPLCMSQWTPPPPKTTSCQQSWEMHQRQGGVEPNVQTTAKNFNWSKTQTWAKNHIWISADHVFNKRALRKNKMGVCVEQNMGMTVQKRRVTGLKQFRLTELRARIPNMPSLCSRKALHCFISVCWVLLSAVECCSLLCFNQNIKYEVKLQHQQR